MDKADDQAQQAESASTRRVVNAEQLIETECYDGDYRSTTACVPVDRSRLAARLSSGGPTMASPCSTVEFRWTDHGLQQVASSWLHHATSLVALILCWMCHDVITYGFFSRAAGYKMRQNSKYSSAVALEVCCK